MKEIFRRFEFRSLLGRVDTLDEALPAATPEDASSLTVAWREGPLEATSGAIGVAAADGRVAVADPSGVVVADAEPG